MTAEFCKAKPGDLVYSIPKDGSPPEKHLLVLRDKKTVRAINAAGTEVDFNPEKFTSTPSEAIDKAITRYWELFTEYTQDMFALISKQRKGEE